MGQTGGRLHAWALPISCVLQCVLLFLRYLLLVSRERVVLDDPKPNSCSSDFL